MRFVLNQSRPRASATLWSTFDCSEVFLGWWTHWLLIFPLLLFEAFSSRFWIIVFSLLLLHVASMSLYVSLCLSFMATSMHPSQRSEQYSICVFPAVIYIMCVGACLVKPAEESGASTSNTCTHLSIFLWIFSNACKLYMHTHKPTLTHTPTSLMLASEEIT